MESAASRGARPAGRPAAASRGRCPVRCPCAQRRPSERAGRRGAHPHAPHPRSWPGGQDSRAEPAARRWTEPHARVGRGGEGARLRESPAGPPDRRERSQRLELAQQRLGRGPVQRLTHAQVLLGQALRDRGQRCARQARQGRRQARLGGRSGFHRPQHEDIVKLARHSLARYIGSLRHGVEQTLSAARGPGKGQNLTGRSGDPPWEHADRCFPTTAVADPGSSGDIGPAPPHPPC